MRVTAMNVYENTITNLQRRQEDLVASQERMSSGKRVTQASDDPVAAARAERALAQMVRTEASQRALEASRNVVLQAETAMGEAGELLQQARELVVSAGNGAHDDLNRKSIAEALQAIRKQLMVVSNRTDGAGAYLFGGQGTDQPPFIDDVGGVIFRGIGGETMVPAGEPLPLSVDGAKAWLGAPNPEAGGADLSVFGVLDRIVGELNTPGRDGAAISETVKSGLRDIDAVSNNLLSQRSRAGETLKRTDAVETRLADSKLAAETERSNAESLDMVAAISEFSRKETGYDAALRSYASVQKLSLFNYISA